VAETGLGPVAFPVPEMAAPGHLDCVVDGTTVRFSDMFEEAAMGVAAVVYQVFDGNAVRRSTLL
jgi:hypothetical protein